MPSRPRMLQREVDIIRRMNRVMVFPVSTIDYGLWAAVSRRMRRQERAFPKGKRETRKEYVDRLGRAAKALPRTLVDKILKDMKRRCERCCAARGGHFPEGGRRR